MGLIRRFGLWLAGPTKSELFYIQRVEQLEQTGMRLCGEIFGLRCALSTLKHHELDPDKISFIERALK